jgi:hypothetical protein
VQAPAVPTTVLLVRHIHVPGTRQPISSLAQLNLAVADAIPNSETAASCGIDPGQVAYRTS